MNPKNHGDRLFEAWREVVPAFDENAGRARFLETAANVEHHPPNRALRSFVVVAAAITIFATLWLVLRPSRALHFSTAAGDGELRAWLATDSSRELPITFSEGTAVTILPDSRGRVDALNSDGASFLLERGEVRAHVVHTGKTDWRFLAGPFEVKVTGTLLDVKWDPSGERFSVRVDEGAVVVHGPDLGDSQVVHAGERCVVDLPAHRMQLSSVSVDDALSPEAAFDAGATIIAEMKPISSSPEVASHAPPVVSVPWTTFEARGDYDGAYAAAATAGMASVLRASSPDELLQLAEVDQLSGHRSAERDALLACRHRFPSSEQSAVAAYQLGRASSASEAATWFDTYLKERPNGPLAREALGRLVEARAAAGDDTGARDAARKYIAAYPNGPQAALARRVLAGARE